MVKAFIFLKNLEDSCIAVHGNFPLIFRQTNDIFQISRSGDPKWYIAHPYSQSLNFFRTAEDISHFAKTAHEIEKSKYFSNIQTES